MHISSPTAYGENCSMQTADATRSQRGPGALVTGLVVRSGGWSSRRRRIFLSNKRGIACLEAQQTNIVVLGPNQAEPSADSYQRTCLRLWPAAGARRAKVVDNGGTSERHRAAGGKRRGRPLHLIERINQGGGADDLRDRIPGAGLEGNPFRQNTLQGRLRAQQQFENLGGMRAHARPEFSPAESFAHRVPARRFLRKRERYVPEIFVEGLDLEAMPAHLVV